MKKRSNSLSTKYSWLNADFRRNDAEPVARVACQTTIAKKLIFFIPTMGCIPPKSHGWRMSLAVILAFLISGGPLSAYYMLPELEILVQDSVLICTGTVVKKDLLEKQGNVQFVKVTVAPEKVFKGSAPKDGQITVISFETDDKDFSRVEDPVSPFPAEKSRVLLFLQKQEENFVPVSPRTSIFEILPGSWLRPMARFSLDQVETFFK